MKYICLFIVIRRYANPFRIYLYFVQTSIAKMILNESTRIMGFTISAVENSRVRKRRGT